MWYTIFIVILIGYMIYGVVHVTNNKSLNRVQKVMWIIVIVMLPVLGVAGYLKSTFEARN